MPEFTTTLDKIVTPLEMEVLYTPTKVEDVVLTSADVNRPGLLLTGYDLFFEPGRLQILGKAEMSYLSTLDEAEQRSNLHTLFAAKPPAVIISRGQEPFEAMFEFAKEENVTLLRSNDGTSIMMSAMISILSVELAQRITRHGVLVEIYGEGVLIVGESGVGKSETAIELVKRGHRLIADDAVELRRVSNRTIIGSAPENIRHFIELRGVGIVNVARIFGSGAVKMSEKIDLIAQFEPWDRTKNYSHTGIETQTTDLLGIQVPSTVIPIMPGRNLAVILETAAINNRQKKMGYNAAKDLMNRLGLAVD